MFKNFLNFFYECVSLIWLVGNNACFDVDAEGFLRFEDSLVCINERCYIASNRQRSWLEAQKCCASISSNLATFERDALINEAFQTTYVGRERMRYLWVGGYNPDWGAVIGNIISSFQ